MKKSLIYLLISLMGVYLFFIASCSSDDEFGDENTFNLDTLYVNPPENITTGFQVIYEVSTIGFPQFLIDIYLSDDENIDANDIKIAETADTDISQSTDQSYVNGIIFDMTDVAGGSGTRFEFSFDQVNWEGDAITQEDLSGKSKYIIGRFYHITGLQIDVDRTRMAVRVSFQ